MTCGFTLSADLVLEKALDQKRETCELFEGTSIDPNQDFGS